MAAAMRHQGSTPCCSANDMGGCSRGQRALIRNQMAAHAARGFDSHTFRQIDCPASSVDESTGLRIRGSQVRILRGAPRFPRMVGRAVDCGGL